jgi:hypothetical protein
MTAMTGDVTADRQIRRPAARSLSLKFTATALTSQWFPSYIGFAGTHEPKEVSCV